MKPRDEFITLERLAVKITSKLKEQGSGCLFYPLDSSDYLYLFTAKHCLYGPNFDNGATNADINVYFEERPVQYSLSADDTILVDEEKDLAIIVLSKQSIEPYAEIIPNVQAFPGQVRRNENCFFRGYPKISEGKADLVDCSYSHPEKEGFKMNANYFLADDISSEEENLKGASGSGVFIKHEGAIQLIGVISSYAGNKIECISVASIEDLLRKSRSRHPYPLILEENACASFVKIINEGIASFGSVEFSLTRCDDALTNLKSVYRDLDFYIKPNYPEHNLIKHHLETIIHHAQRSVYSPSVGQRLNAGDSDTVLESLHEIISLYGTMT